MNRDNILALLVSGAMTFVVGSAVLADALRILDSRRGWACLLILGALGLVIAGGLTLSEALERVWGLL